MLEVIGFHPVEDTALEIDEYVPLRFRCQDTFDPVPLYWRTGDFHRQLIEIGLNPYSGAVCKITVTGLGEHSLAFRYVKYRIGLQMHWTIKIGSGIKDTSAALF
jgi:hypothetical protein